MLTYRCLNRLYIGWIAIGYLLVAAYAAFGQQENPNNPNEPAYVKAERAALLQFADVVKRVPTATAQKSGRWDDPATWGLSIPKATEHVYIPPQMTVTIDSQTAVAKFIRIDGTLKFARDKDTRLVVDTIVGPLCASTLDAGTQADPITAKCEVIFRDAGPIDIAEDPREFGHGYVGHKTLIWGQTKSSQAEFVSALAGATTVTLTAPPINWQVGDTIVLAGTGTGPSADPGYSPPFDTQEKVKITSVAGAVIGIDTPLKYPHGPLRFDPCFCINLTRNVIFRSEKAGYGPSVGKLPEVPDIVKRRGHFMVMGCGVGESKIGYAQFDDLGRTDKRVALDAVKFKDGKRLAELNGRASGTNQVGRYSLHGHHGGRLGTPMLVQGCAVNGSPGWGYTNHSSNVHFLDCVGHDCIGAIFSNEIGDEVGLLKDCTAIYARGGHSNVDGNVNNPLYDREQGTNGSGFWSQTAGRMRMRNIKAANCSAGISFWAAPGTQVYSAEANRVVGNIMGSIDPADIDPAGPDKYLLDFIDPATGTIDAFRSRADLDGGLFISAFEGGVLIGPHGPNYKYPSVYKNLRGGGVKTQYATHQTFEGAKMSGGAKVNAPYIVGFNSGGGDSHSLQIKNSEIENFGRGYYCTSMGINSVIGCKLSNGQDVYITGASFVNISAIALRPREVWVEGNTHKYTPIAWEGVGGHLFIMDRIVFEKKQLYHAKSEPDYIPLPTVDPTYTPPYYAGKTNAQLLAEYGVAVNGDVTPAEAVLDPKVGYKTGPISNRCAVVIRQGPTDIQYRKPSGTIQKLPIEVYRPKEHPPVMVNIDLPVKPGWQNVPFEFEGQKYSVNVFGTGTAPPPPVPVVASVTVAPASLTLEVGKTATLTAVVKDQNGAVMPGKSVAWTVANLNATATANGLTVTLSVATVGNGTVNATCEGKQGTATITVTPPQPPPLVVTTITISPATLSLETGKTGLLMALVKDQNGNALLGRPVVWTTSAATIATVSGAGATGTVAGVTGGSTTISAACEGVKGTATVTVSPPPPVRTIKDITIRYTDGTSEVKP